MADFTYCPLCKSTEYNRFLTLQDMPLVNTINDSENKYSLSVYHCSNCALVFVNTPKTPVDIFSNYTYFSSWSSTWLKHCRSLFWELAESNYINKDSFIVEIASNDGYMLKNFTDNGYKDVLGIEPAANVAAEAQNKGIPTVNAFFTKDLAHTLAEDKKADCIMGLNVLAHVPDIMGFLSGISELLNKEGFAVLEFHHLLNLINKLQFDTIYHEHFSYLSFFTVESAVQYLGMRIFNVQKVQSQGGSLRVFLSHKCDSAVKKFPMHDSVGAIRHEEQDYKLLSFDCMTSFALETIDSIKRAKQYIDNLLSSGKVIAGYGAAAKAVVFINSLELNSSKIKCVADINPVKQGHNIPGTEIPIVAPDELIELSPDYVIIFPWNLKEEISSGLRKRLPAETRFIVFSPDPETFV